MILKNYNNTKQNHLGLMLVSSTSTQHDRKAIMIIRFNLDASIEISDLVIEGIKCSSDRTDEARKSSESVEKISGSAEAHFDMGLSIDANPEELNTSYELVEKLSRTYLKSAENIKTATDKAVKQVNKNKSEQESAVASLAKLDLKNKEIEAAANEAFAAARMSELCPTSLDKYTHAREALTKALRVIENDKKVFKQYRGLWADLYGTLGHLQEKDWANLK